ncbi:hypothetical protein SeMB42_g04431, partial [Synchytrium endobioticum]
PTLCTSVVFAVYSCTLRTADLIRMVKSINIILVIILTALITTIGAAPEWDDDAIMNVARKMIKCAAGVVNKRTAALGNPFLGCMHDWSDQTYIGAQIAGIVSKSIPPFSPFQNQQLFQEPIESMRTSQVHFTRAYHSLVFEKLKTLFMKIELCIAELLNSEKKLNRVATYLLMHHDLEERCRQLLRRRSENCSKWRELELPHYDWGHVRTVLLPTLLNQLAQSQSPICNDVTPAGMLECFQMRVQNVIEGRKEEVRRGLPFNLRAVLDPTSYVATLIAQIRSDSRPFAFTEEQLLEEPKASMLQDQLHLTRVYHRLVVETLKTLVIMIKNNLRAHEHKVKLEQALAEVECAQRMHQNLESAYKQIHQKTHNRSIGRRRKLKLPVNGLAPLDSTQSTREAQNYAYNDQPVFNHGPGSGLEASTGQPGPWMVERVTREDSVAKQPQRVGIHDDPKQQVLIDFPGVADMTWKAAPGNHGHSHDDRDALTDDRYSSELHRPPSGHSRWQSSKKYSGQAVWPMVGFYMTLRFIGSLIYTFDMCCVHELESSQLTANVPYFNVHQESNLFVERSVIAAGTVQVNGHSPTLQTITIIKDGDIPFRFEYAHGADEVTNLAYTNMLIDLIHSKRIR